MDIERAQFAENAVRYQAGITFITHQLRMLNAAVSSGTVIMGLFNVFNIAGSALTAQSARLNAVASNMANADSIAVRMANPTAPSRWFSKRRQWAVRLPRVMRVRQVVKTPRRRAWSRSAQSGRQWRRLRDDVQRQCRRGDENMISASRSYQTNADDEHGEDADAAYPATRPVKGLNHGKRAIGIDQYRLGHLFDQCRRWQQGDEFGAGYPGPFPQAADDAVEESGPAEPASTTPR